jgi:thymidylate synthase
MLIPNVRDIREFFIGELNDEAFTIDRTGQKTIEMLGASFIADEPAIFGEPNEKYIEAEISWYESQSTNINRLAEIYGKSPAAWEYSANPYGEINSNYGTLIFSDMYFNQYDRVLNELLENPDGRRASMVYNRPNIWIDFEMDGKNDFICTNSVTYYIRDGLLHSVVQMRSNDVVYGYKNDYAWQRYVMDKLCWDYNHEDRYNEGRVIEPGLMHWQVQNLHVYERHFNMVK